MRWMVNATPRPLYHGEGPGTHYIGGWLGTRAGLDWCGKSRPPQGIDLRIFEPVTSRCTNWTISAPLNRHISLWKYMTIPLDIIFEINLIWYRVLSQKLKNSHQQFRYLQIIQRCLINFSYRFRHSRSSSGKILGLAIGYSIILPTENRIKQYLLIYFIYLLIYLLTYSLIHLRTYLLTLLTYFIYLFPY